MAIGLYDEDSHLEQCKVYRGNAMDDYTNDYFDIPDLGNYKLGFFAGSYDRTGGTVLGATLKVKAFQMTVPIWHTGQHHMGSPNGGGSSACPFLPSVSWNDPLCVPRLAMAAADGLGAAAEGSAPRAPVATEGEDCAAFTPLGGGVDPALAGTWSVAPPNPNPNPIPNPIPNPNPNPNPNPSPNPNPNPNPNQVGRPVLRPRHEPRSGGGHRLHLPVSGLAPRPGHVLVQCALHGHDQGGQALYLPCISPVSPPYLPHIS